MDLRADTLLPKLQRFVATATSLLERMNQDLRLSSQEVDYPVIAIPLRAAKRATIPRRGSFDGGEQGQVAYRIHGNGIDLISQVAELRFDFHPYPPRQGITHVSFSAFEVSRYLQSLEGATLAERQIGELLVQLHQAGKLARTDWPFGGPFGGQYHFPAAPAPDSKT